MTSSRAKVNSYRLFGPLLSLVLDFQNIVRSASDISNLSLFDNQGMTDRRSCDRRSDRRSFFRDHEVIADRHLVMRSQGDRDREI